MTDRQLGAGNVERQTVVRVGQVRAGWKQDGDPMPGRARRRADEERDVLLAALAARRTA